MPHQRRVAAALRQQRRVHDALDKESAYLYVYSKTAYASTRAVALALANGLPHAARPFPSAHAQTRVPVITGNLSSCDGTLSVQVVHASSPSIGVGVVGADVAASVRRALRTPLVHAVHRTGAGLAADRAVSGPDGRGASQQA